MQDFAFGHEPWGRSRKSLRQFLTSPPAHALAYRNRTVDSEGGTEDEVRPSGQPGILERQRKRNGPDGYHDGIFLNCEARFQSIHRTQAQSISQALGMDIHQGEKRENSHESRGIDSHERRGFAPSDSLRNVAARQLRKHERRNKLERINEEQNQKQQNEVEENGVRVLQAETAGELVMHAPDQTSWVKHKAKGIKPRMSAMSSP